MYTENELQTALKWSSAPAQLLVPTPETPEVEGWVYDDFNEFARRAWSGTDSFGYYGHDGKRGMVLAACSTKIYATEKDAYIARRQALQAHYAKKLLQIDEKIEQVVHPSPVSA